MSARKGLACGGCPVDRAMLLGDQFPSAISVASAPITWVPNPKDPFWVQLPPATLVLRRQLSLGDEPARPAQARVRLPRACWGLSRPLPWEGIPRPTGLWCNQQGSTCPCPDRVQHAVAPATPLPPTQVQEGLKPVASSRLLTWGPAELGHWPG